MIDQEKIFFGKDRKDDLIWNYWVPYPPATHAASVRGTAQACGSVTTTRHKAINLMTPVVICMAVLVVRATYLMTLCANESASTDIS